MAIQSRRRSGNQCQQFQVEFNRDIKSYSNGKISRSLICSKWSRKLEGTSCRSLKYQLRSFCSKTLGVN